MPRAKLSLMRISIAVSARDVEQIKRAAQRAGEPYTVWARNRLLEAARTKKDGHDEGR